MRAELDLTNLSAGELSPRLRGRVDVSKYWNGCETMLNFVVQPQGGATRRPGTQYIAAVNDQAHAPRLIDFVFSTVQAYVLEVGNLYARVYRNDGQVVSGGAPVTITLPYTTADLPNLTWCQSADTLYLFHPNYYPRTLTRSSDTSWTVAQPAFVDGPYLDVNATSTTLTLSAYAKPGDTVTVTASAIVGINASPGNTGRGFLSSDVGRMLRFQGQNLWCWLFISAYTDSTHVSAIVQAAAANGAAGGTDGQAWQASTVYRKNAIVANGVNYYVCKQAGLSATSGGPTGSGTGIVDNAALWDLYGTPWAVNTVYPVGYLVWNGGKYYRCTVGGTSAGSGSGPTGTGGAITDNSVTWAYTTRDPTLVSAVWALGKWSATTGFPWCGAFWQQRLMLGATNNQPQAIEGSVSGDFTNFAPTQADGTVADDSAVSWLLDDDQVNAIHWLSPAGSAQAMQLGIGTAGGEHILQAATTAAALTPTSVQAYRETLYGSAATVRPLRIGKALLFPNRPGTKLHEWSFQWQMNGYTGPDLAVLAEHLLRNGVTRMAWQQNPLGIVWMIADSHLIGMTYLREQDVTGFHRHQLGGDLFGAPPIVEDIVVIPSADGSYDELWLAVARATAAGGVSRTIEVLRPFFQSRNTDDAWFLDCALATALTYPAIGVAVTGLSALTQTDDRTLWNGTGGLVLQGVSSTTLRTGQVVRVNGGVGTVGTVYTATTAQFIVTQPLTSTAIAPAGAWSLTDPVTTVSGLTHLAGLTVGVLGDGVDLGQQTVSNTGTIALASPGAARVVAGLPYTSALVTVPLEAAARQGAASQGKVKLADKMFLRLDASAGGKFGARTQDPDYDTISDVLEAIPAPAFTGAPPLVTGVRRVSPTAAADYEGRFIVQQTAPYPLTVLAIGARVDLGDIAA